MQAKLHQIRLGDQSAKVAVEIIEGARTVQLLGKEQYFLDKYWEKMCAIRSAKRKVTDLEYSNYIYFFIT
jgi:ABC-type bacteriocin/lantibiotic exporter with double-glycine peptidase domain